MKGHNAPRYPLNPTAPRIAGLLGAICISAVVYEPLTQLARTGNGQVESFLPLLVFIPVVGLAIRYANTCVELRDDALLVHGVLTQRIPLDRIQSISIVLPGIWESRFWDQYISALVRTLHGQKWIGGAGYCRWVPASAPG